MEKSASPKLEHHDGIDESRCPLCSQTNHCALTEDKAASSCWCQQRHIDAAVLARLPTHTRNKACICSSCIEKFSNI